MKITTLFKSKVPYFFGGLFLLCSFTTLLTEIPLDPDTGLAVYKNGDNVPGKNAGELYDRGLAWVNKYYINPVGVLQTQDKAKGEITGKARFKLSKTDHKGVVNPNAGFVAYQFTLQFKDEKYRYVIDRIRWEQPSYYDVSRWSDASQANYDASAFNSFIEQTSAYFDEATLNLEEYMKVGEPVKKDDW